MLKAEQGSIHSCYVAVLKRVFRRVGLIAFTIVLASCSGSSNNSGASESTNNQSNTEFDAEPVAPMLGDTPQEINGNIDVDFTADAVVTVSLLDGTVLGTGPLQTDGAFSIVIDSQDNIEPVMWLEITANDDDPSVPEELAVLFRTSNVNQPIVVNEITALVSLLVSQVDLEAETKLVQQLVSSGLINTNNWENADTSTLNFDVLDQYLIDNSRMAFIGLIASDWQLNNGLSEGNMSFFNNAHGGIVLPEISGRHNVTVYSNSTVTIPLQTNISDTRINQSASVLLGSDIAEVFKYSDGFELILNPGAQTDDRSADVLVFIENTETSIGRYVSIAVELVQLAIDTQASISSEGGRTSSNDGFFSVDVAASENEDSPEIEVKIHSTSATNPTYFVEVDVSALNAASFEDVPDIYIRGKRQSSIDMSQAAAQQRSATPFDIECDDKNTESSFCLGAIGGWFDGGANHRIEIENSNGQIRPTLFSGDPLYCRDDYLNLICSSYIRLSAAELWFSGTREQYQSTDWNTKEPVILVHGYIPGGNVKGDLDYWRDLAEIIADHGNYSVFVYKWDTDQKFQTAANDLADVIENINAKTGRKVHAIGHSMGGVLLRTLEQQLPGVKSNNAEFASITTMGAPYGGLEDYDGGAGALSEIGCNSLTCHQLGDRQRLFILDRLEFSSVTSLLRYSEKSWATYFDIESEPGELTRQMQTGWVPTVPYHVGIGLLSNRYWDFSTVLDGDGLIPLVNQRFHNDAEYSLLSRTATSDEGMNEYIIGSEITASRQEIPKGNYPNSSFPLDNVRGYRHGTGVILRRNTLTEAGITHEQVSGGNKHGSFELIKHVLGLHESSATMLDFSPLDKPVITNATLLNGQLHVEWQPVAGAHSYEIFIGESNTVSDQDYLISSSVSGSVLTLNDFPDDVSSVFLSVRAVSDGVYGELSEVKSTFAAAGAVKGQIFDSSTGLVIEGARVTLDLDGNKLTAITDSDGEYYLEVPSNIDNVVVSIEFDGFRSTTFNVFPDDSGNYRINNFSASLVKADPNTIYISSADTVYHLGDDRFSGSINSQFQKSAQSTALEATFDVPDYIAVQPFEAHLFMTLKGAQLKNPIKINDTIIGYADKAPNDGSFAEYSWLIDSSQLVLKRNVLLISSHRNNDYDDWEFVNVYMTFTPL